MLTKLKNNPKKSQQKIIFSSNNGNFIANDDSLSKVVSSCFC